jgi:signal transduction histidine kinase
VIGKVLPRGLPLPEELWVRRHRAVLAVLWSSVVALAVYGLARGRPTWHVAGDLSLIVVPGIVATMRGPRSVRMAAASLGTLSACAVTVHLADGVIEAHFAFFVAVPLITLYQSWPAFGLAAAYVLVHHGVFGVWQPEAVYNHPAAIDHPWHWAAIHAGFVIAASAASIAAWRISEQAAMVVADQQAHEEELRSRRRHALEIQDDIVQGIVVAKLARSLEDLPQLDQALDATLAKARAIVSELLENQPVGELELVRRSVPVEPVAPPPAVTAPARGRAAGSR